MALYIIFSVMLFLVCAYFFAFERCRYKTAKMMADGLGGTAVYRMGRSYMRRNHEGVEERAWIVPDDKMAWGSILSILKPSVAMLFLERDRGLGFRFHIEPKTGVLFQTLSLLKEANFRAPGLDESLCLRTDNNAKADLYFSVPERQEALGALFFAGFAYMKGDHTVIQVTMKGITAEMISPEKIAFHFRLLSKF